MSLAYLSGSFRVLSCLLRGWRVLPLCNPEFGVLPRLFRSLSHRFFEAAVLDKPSACPENRLHDEPPSKGFGPGAHKRQDAMTAHSSSAFVTWGIRVAGALASAVGALFFLVWLAGGGNEFPVQGIIIPKTNAALALILSGAALLLLAPENAGGLRRPAGGVLAAAAGLLGALTLGEHLFGLDFGIDQLLATEIPGVARTASPNRMGPPASLSMVLVGLGLLAVAFRRRAVAPYVGLAVCVMNLVPAVGFLYGIHGFYDQSRLTGIAWPTVVALSALGIGLVLSEDKRGPLALLLRDDAGGALFRRMLRRCC